MRIRAFVTTALLTCVLTLAGGTAAHAADPIPIPILLPVTVGDALGLPDDAGPDLGSILGG